MAAFFTGDSIRKRVDPSLFPGLFAIHAYGENVTYLSPSLQKLLGREKLSRNGIDVSRIILREDWLTITQDETFTPETTRPYTIRLRHFNGGELLSKVLVSRRLDDNEPVYFIIGVIAQACPTTATTACRSAKMGKSQELFLEEYTAVLSHEIRTPVNSLVGLIELLQSTPLNEEQTTLVQTISSVSANLLMLLSDSIDATRFRAGRMILRYEEFDPRPLLKTMVERYQLLYPHLHLSFTYSPLLPTKLLGDAHRIDQMLTNVFTNSLKYTPKGSVSLIVEPGESPEFIRFTIEDTGIGISPENQERLFNPFIQVEGQEHQASSGLGLYISRSIAELHGGHVHLKSHEQKGTRVTFALPLLRKPHPQLNSTEMRILDEPRSFDDPLNAPPQQSPETLTESTPNFSGRRILVVDDNEVNLLVVKKFIMRWGYEVDCVDSGEEALKALDAEKYGLIFADIRMPGMDGLTLAKKIRERSDPKAQTPIIALTASTESGMKEKIEEVEMNGYIFKPFNASDLLVIIEKYIGKIS